MLPTSTYQILLEAQDHVVGIEASITLGRSAGKKHKSHSPTATIFFVLCDCSHCVFLPLVLGVRAVHIAHCSSGFTCQKITCPLFFSPSLPHIYTPRADIPSSFPFILSACRKLGSTSALQATPAHHTRLCSDSRQRKFQFKGWEVKR